jgi:chromatin segregation and condensation protein Rec8/ScpA/Scc1 (kleisin family)
MVRIARKLRGGSFRFAELFEEDYSREEVITMFLAILEMAKLNRLKIQQGSAYDEIFLSA